MGGRGKRGRGGGRGREKTFDDNPCLVNFCNLAMYRAVKESSRRIYRPLTNLSLVMVALICSDPGVTVNADLTHKHTYKQAPYQDCDEKEYQMVLDKMPKNVDWGKLSEYEQMDMTVGSQELACAAGNCEIQ